MKRGRLIALAIPVLFVLGFAASYPLLYPTYTVRYRLTVNAMADGQPHSGSSVIEVRVSRQPQWIAEVGPWAFRSRGEAIFVDLGAGRNVVAFLNPGPSEGKDCVTILFRAFQVPFLVGHVADLENLYGERNLQPANWPPFVTFQNVSDPLSIKPVKPSAMRDAYGANVGIESVTVAITQEPVTYSLKQKLSWIGWQFSDQDLFALAKQHVSRGSFVIDS